MVKQGTHRTRRIFALIALDIKNLSSWKSIIIEKLQASTYMIKTINNNLNHRRIPLRDNDNKIEEVTVTIGIPQGSILGPMLWNLPLYDKVFRLNLEESIKVIDFVDDITIVSLIRLRKH